MKVNKNGSYTQLGIMIIITLVTQLFILLRASIVAANFGISVELDAFNFTNNLATLVFSFIGAGITTVLIPNLGEKKKESAVNTFITMLYLAATVILLIMLLFRKELVEIFGGNGGRAFINVSTNLSIILIFAQYLSSFLGLSNAILQFREQFNRTKIAVLICNILLVVILMFFTGNSIKGYALAILITNLINVLLQFFMMKNGGFSYTPEFNFQDKYYKRMLRAFGPIILSTGLYQISLMIDTIIASGLGEGQISILNYSNYIVGMVNVLLIVNITSFLYPRIARSIKENDSQQKLADYIFLINGILLIIVVAFVIVGEDMIRILYMRGQFTEEVGRIVFICTILYIISIPASAARDIIYKYFYAHGNTFSPFSNGLIISILNIAISYILSKLMGLYGVVIGTSVTNILSMLLISVRLKINYKVNFDYKRFLKDNLKLTGIAAITLLFMLLLKSFYTFESPFISVIIYGLACVGVYALLLFLIKSRVLKIKL